jgi:hypothetical protein
MCSARKRAIPLQWPSHTSTKTRSIPYCRFPRVEISWPHFQSNLV